MRTIEELKEEIEARGLHVVYRLGPYPTTEVWEGEYRLGGCWSWDFDSVEFMCSCALKLTDEEREMMSGYLKEALAR